MRVRLAEWFTLIQISSDVLSVLVAFSLAYYLKVKGIVGGEEYVLGFDQYFPFVLIIALFQIVVFFSLRLYSLARRPFVKEIGLLFYACIIWSGIVLALLFLQRQFYFSRLLLASAIIIFFSLGFLTRFLLRIFRRIAYKIGVGVRGVVVIGAKEQSMYLADQLQRMYGWQLLGIIKEENLEQLSLSELFSPWQKDNHSQIEEVWLASDEVSPMREEEIFDFCADNKITYRYVPNFFASSSKKVESLFVGDYPLLEVLPTPLTGWGKIIKRVLDIVGSFVGLIILSPIFLLIGLLIKVFTPGPVFIGLERVGIKKNSQLALAKPKSRSGFFLERVGEEKKENTFTMYKFRSMSVGAHKKRDELMALNERKDGPLFKLKDDPRVTPLGRFMRKFRIDELLQLWNVLKGDMALIGPRAHEHGEVSKYIHKQMRILRIKPGMTGMAQVSGASDLPFEQEVKLESYYIQNWSLWLDVQILLRTVWVVITKKGAA